MTGNRNARARPASASTDVGLPSYMRTSYNPRCAPCAAASAVRRMLCCSARAREVNTLA